MNLPGHVERVSETDSASNPSVAPAFCQRGEGREEETHWVIGASSFSSGSRAVGMVSEGVCRAGLSVHIFTMYTFLTGLLMGNWMKARQSPTIPYGERLLSKPANLRPLCLCPQGITALEHTLSPSERPGKTTSPESNGLHYFVLSMPSIGMLCLLTWCLHLVLTVFCIH